MPIDIPHHMTACSPSESRDQLLAPLYLPNFFAIKLLSFDNGTRASKGRDLGSSTAGDKVESNSCYRKGDCHDPANSQVIVQ